MFQESGTRANVCPRATVAHSYLDSCYYNVLRKLYTCILLLTLSGCSATNEIRTTLYEGKLSDSSIIDIIETGGKVKGVRTIYEGVVPPKVLDAHIKLMEELIRVD